MTKDINTDGFGGKINITTNSEERKVSTFNAKIEIIDKKLNELHNRQDYDYYKTWLITLFGALISLFNYTLPSDSSKFLINLVSGLILLLVIGLVVVVILFNKSHYNIKKNQTK